MAVPRPVISRSGGPSVSHPSWLGTVGHDLVSTIYGIPTGIGELGKSVYESSPIAQIVRAAEGKPIDWTAMLGRPIYHNIIAPTARSEYDYYRHLGRNLRQGHVLQLPIDALMFASAGVGRVAAAGITARAIEEGAIPASAAAAARRTALLKGEYGGPLRTIEVSGGGDVPVTTRVLPRKAWRAARMTKTDALLKMVPKTTPVIGEFKRAARAGQRVSQRQYLKLLADPVVQRYARSFNAMNADERAAFQLKLRVPLETDLQSIQNQWRSIGTPISMDTLRISERPKVIANFRTPTAKMAKTRAAYEEMGPAAQKILEDRQAIDAAQILEGHYKGMLIARGAEILSKSQSRIRQNKIDSKILRIEQSRGRSIKQARTQLGMQDLRAATQEGRRIVIGTKIPGGGRTVGLAESARRQAEYAPFVNASDSLGDEARILRDQARRVAQGEIDHNVLNSLSIDVPPERASFHGMAGAVTEAEIRGRLETLQGQLGRMPNEVSNPNWKQEIDDKIANLQAQHDRLSKKTQQPWRDRLSNDISTLRSQKRSLTGHAQRKVGLEASVAKAQQDLDYLRSGASVERPFSEVQASVLGQLHDRLGPAFDAYEKALAAEHGQQLEAERTLALKARQATNKQAIDAAREKRIKLLQGQRAQMQDLNETQDVLHELKMRVSAHTGRLYFPGLGGATEGLTTPEDVIAGMQREVLAAGEPLPGYLPDQPAGQVPRGYALSQGSIAAARPAGTVYQAGGDLFRTGQIDLVGDVLTQRYVDNAKWAYNHDLHKWAMSIARKVSPGDNLPDGYEWVRRYRGEKMPYTLSTAEGHKAATRDVFDLSGMETISEKNLPDGEIATDARGDRLAIPKQVADHFRSDYRQSTSVGRKVFNRFTDIWRSLVLHLRIPWLENNLFGNILLAGIRFAGINGLKALLGMIAETKGGQAVARLLNMDVTHLTGLSREDVLSILPEHTRPGTFFGTQLPVSSKVNRFVPETATTAAEKSKRAGAAALGFLPGVDIRSETWLRRWGLNTVLHGSPEVKAIYKAMPKQTRSWREAMKKALEDPNELELTSREVNDAMGNFLSLSKVERDAIRQLVPFYAWFREITRIAVKLPLDAPIRTNIVLNLGKIGAEINPQDVPFSLRGSIPLGPANRAGQRSVLSLSAPNPFASVIQAGRALGPVLALKPSATNLEDVSSMLGPIPGSIAETYLHPGGLPLAYQIPYQLFAGSPEYRAFDPYKSKLYPTRTSLQSFLQFAGSPKRTYDVGVGAKQAAAGR